MIRPVQWVLVSVLTIAPLTAACTSSTSAGGAGTVCATNSDCASGLTCQPLALFADGGCSSAGNECSRTCVTDPDCASLGPKYRCFEGCPGGPKTCGAVP